MADNTDRFTRMQKVAIFLIALGQERTREILVDVDLDTLEQVNLAMAALGEVTAQEKAGVMLEFAHFFYEDKPLTSAPLTDSGPIQALAPSQTAAPLPAEPKPPKSDKPLDLGTLNPPEKAPNSQTQEEEQAILHTLEQMRQRLDPGQIDWGRAGYDFGDGFKGSSPDRQ